MSKKLKINFFIPMLIFFGLLADGLISKIFFKQLYAENGNIMVPRLIILILILISFYFPRNKMILYGIVFGFLYDSYYVGILGIYIAIFPLIVYVTTKLKQVLNPNLITIGMIVFINLSILETMLYWIYRVLGFTAIDMNTFMAGRLGPTLLLNLVFFIFTFYPLKKAMIKMTGN
ncbi:rod shape-determining protein MreD [Carnobacterium iners]|uniref:Rod shape-determining protein MreD n=1 Tax=Carnobacterium iners TaxID=1073423 RepID=A0A1X7NMR0_9LACT|nr:rod shape-determining protein MreD [Carnobacterium iners]SEK31957.1 rod shape-determining protein MreD [Carnobacterium iners]SMH39188.1 rod shape-determining protein MreD [Carnobacterium iners]